MSDIINNLNENFPVQENNQFTPIQNMNYENNPNMIYQNNNIPNMQNNEQQQNNFFFNTQQDQGFYAPYANNNNDGYNQNINNNGVYNPQMVNQAQIPQNNSSFHKKQNNFIHDCCSFFVICFFCSIFGFIALFLFLWYAFSQDDYDD